MIVIDHQIYTKKRTYKIKPLCYKCLDLFYKKHTMSIDKLMEAYEKKYHNKLTRSQAHGSIGQLKMGGYLKNGGLAIWKLIRKREE